MWFEVLAFESPALDLDITVFIQLGIFVLLMLFLKRFVLEPYFIAYDKRQELTEGARDDAKAMELKASEAQTNYETERQKAFVAGESMRRQAVAEASAEAAKILDTARENVQKEMAEKQAELDSDLDQARRSANRETDIISTQIANKILV